METYQFILSVVIPAVTSFGGVLASIFICIGKVKSLTGNTIKENSMLKKQLAECKEKSKELEEYVSNQVIETKDLIEKKETEVVNLAKENASLREIISVIMKMKDLQETMKQQLTTLLDKKEN